MVRKLSPAAPSDLTLTHAVETRQQRRRIEAFAGMTDTRNPLYQSLNRRLLVAQSADLPGSRCGLRTSAASAPRSTGSSPRSSCRTAAR